MNHIPFSLERNTLTVIPTDLAEPEALIRKLAEETQASCPTQFAGKKPCVYFKLSYVAPCEKFRKLRSLILLIQEATGLRANFHGIVALDVSEWVGHEQEEYFIATLKYLFDHSDHIHAALILKTCTGTKLSRFLRHVCLGVPGVRLKTSPQIFFSDSKVLESYCRNYLRQESRTITQQSLTLLTNVLMRQELSEAHSLALIDQTLQDLVSAAPNQKRITEVTVQQYLECPNTMLAMMLGTPALEERNNTHYEPQL